jgi:signal transduction histidine kinase/CheY-like chemotaxis protein
VIPVAPVTARNNDPGAAPTRIAQGALSFQSFRARLLILILMIVIPALVGALYSNLEERQIEKTRVREGASAISQLAAAKAENFVTDARQLLATLTQFPFLLLAKDQSFSETHLANFRKLSPGYANFGLIETNGIVFCTADSTNSGMDFSNRQGFQRVLESRQFSVGNFHDDVMTGERVLNFGYPIMGDGGELQRVLYASLKLSLLSKAIAGIQVPEGGGITVLDQSGNVLARNSDASEWVGRDLGRLPEVRRILTGRGEDFELSGADKVSRLYAVTVVSDGARPSLFVMVEVPLTVLFARANYLLFRNLLILVVTGLVLWLLIRFYAKRHFFHPLNTLSATAQRLAVGDLGARTGHIEGSMELVQLGRTLDDMAESVQRHTVQLVRSNKALRAEIVERERAEQQVRDQERERKQLEQQLLRSQRMESIGALAGGIAHDLNNALVPVLMGSEMLKEGAGEADRAYLLDLIMSSAKRCTAMVKQVLSFARGKRGEAGTVPMHHLITEMAKVASDTFPKSIVVRSQASKDLWPVAGNATELYQILLNLCVNARDAMPNGGTLVLTGENFELAKGSASQDASLPPRRYVVLSVSDTGMGIPPEHRARIFEPFFTTKTPEKGTGLGLSIVATVVRNHKGLIKLQSEVGKGTEFRIYMPAADMAPNNGAKQKEASLPAGHGEMILLADDELVVLELAKTTLENYGYRVLTAANGLEAIAGFETHKNEISLVVMDTDMPFLDGIGAILAMRKIASGVSVIMASASKSDTVLLQREDLSHLATLNKPYGVEELLQAVAASLKGRVGADAHGQGGNGHADKARANCS